MAAVTTAASTRCRRKGGHGNGSGERDGDGSGSGRCPHRRRRIQLPATAARRHLRRRRRWWRRRRGSFRGAPCPSMGAGEACGFVDSLTPTLQCCLSQHSGPVQLLFSAYFQVLFVGPNQTATLLDAREGEVGLLVQELAPSEIGTF